MSRSELLQHFYVCRRYKQAQPWQKPFLNPRRFLRNQPRSRGLSSTPIGVPHTTAAFHFPEFTGVSGEGVSREIESYGVFEEALTEAFLHLVRPGQVVVDVGMHLGYYTTLFACLVTERGQVHAFEPTPSTRELARPNLERFPQIVVHPEAVWSSVQPLSFRDYGTAWMAFNSFTKAKLDGVPEPRLFSVQTTTLDVLRQTLNQPIALVKIDAESAEREIIKGAQELIRLDQPLISLEVGDQDGAPTSRALVDDLQRLEYAPWEFSQGRFQRHQPRRAYDYDNLLFAPAARELSSV